MPRPLRSYGRPGTPVIPSDWSASHAPVVAATFTATCEIRDPHPAAVALDADLSVTSGPADSPLYTGACRVLQLNSQESRELLADQDATGVAYLVEIPRDIDVPLRAHIKVAATDDPALDGRHLLVEKVGRGSEQWTRALYAVEDQTAPEPT